MDQFYENTHPHSVKWNDKLLPNDSVMKKMIKLVYDCMKFKKHLRLHFQCQLASVLHQIENPK